MTGNTKLHRNECEAHLRFMARSPWYAVIKFHMLDINELCSNSPTQTNKQTNKNFNACDTQQIMTRHNLLFIVVYVYGCFLISPSDVCFIRNHLINNWNMCQTANDTLPICQWNSIPFYGYITKCTNCVIRRYYLLIYCRARFFIVFWRK